MLRLMFAATAFMLFAAMPSARAASPQELEANKKTVRAFEDAALNQKDFAAASRNISDRVTPSTIPTPLTARRGSGTTSHS